jgi:DNA-binding YbaB/EbfC family protein
MDIKELLGKMTETRRVFSDIQKELESKTVEGSAGGGLVKVIANGLQDITDVDIDPELIRMKDKKLLQDLIKAAANQAREKAVELSQNLFAQQIKDSAFNLSDIQNIFSKKGE